LYTQDVATLSQALIFLLVSLIDMQQPTEALIIDYIQDSAPVATLTVTPIADTDRDAYIVVVTPADDQDSPSGESVRIEQSDLYAHQYFVFGPEGSAVMDVSSFRSLRAGSEWSPGQSAPVAGPVHLLERAGITIVIAESESAILISR
jgi:hypothetical protein